MTDNDPDAVPDLVKSLADGISTAVTVQTRYWLALALASLFVIVPQYSWDATSGAESVKLPLGLPSVNPAWFALVSVLLLSTLVVAFAAAEAHLVRTYALARKMIDHRKGDGVIAGERERDLLEALQTPSLTQVSSIAEVILGRYQFASARGEYRGWMRRLLSTGVYAVMKPMVIAVWLALPAGALALASWRFFKAEPLSFWSTFFYWLAIAAVAAAAVSLLICLVLEIMYWLSRTRQLWRGLPGRPPKTTARRRRGR